MTLHLTIHRCSLHSNQIVSLYISPDNFQSWSSKEIGLCRQHGQNLVHRHIFGSCTVYCGHLHTVQIVELKARLNSSATLRVRILKLSGRSAANSASKGHPNTIVHYITPPNAIELKKCLVILLQITIHRWYHP